MNRNTIFIIPCLMVVLFSQSAIAQNDNSRKWGIEMSVGGSTIHHDDDVSWELMNDEGNVFSINTDYYLKRHIALSGGLTLEQNGLFTNQSDGIGLMKHWTAGIHAGVKWYPLNPKYIVQPYIAGTIYTNVINLPHQRGKKNVHSGYGYMGDGVLSYNIQHAVASISPRVGAEIRIIGSMSLTVAWDYRWELYGHTEGKLMNTSGTRAGETFVQRSNNARGVISLGLKYDFPSRNINISERSYNLIHLLFSLLSGK